MLTPLDAEAASTKPYPPSGSARKIIHCDCDCFYAAVELLDKPHLADCPVAVGGSADHRGVLTTCNYIAREFGLHSAMSTKRAQMLCPDLVVLPVDMKRYRAVSRQIQAIFAEFASAVEPLSLDEAFLDVSDTTLHQGSATLIARAIKQKVRESTGITISAGVAPNKFLAKVASDWEKPDGLTVISPQHVDQFVKALPVNKIPGVGKVTAKRLEKDGISLCVDLQKETLAVLVKKYGKFGQRLYELSFGIDNRVVSAHRQRKSYSHETTLDRDLRGLKECHAVLERLFLRLSEGVLPHLQGNKINKVFIKVKFSDFSLTTASRSTDQVTPELAAQLLETALQRKQLGVRLIGIGVGLEPRSERQLSIF